MTGRLSAHMKRSLVTVAIASECKNSTSSFAGYLTDLAAVRLHFSIITTCMSPRLPTDRAGLWERRPLNLASEQQPRFSRQRNPRRLEEPGWPFPSLNFDEIDALHDSRTASRYWWLRTPPQSRSSSGSSFVYSTWLRIEILYEESENNLKIELRTVAILVQMLHTFEADMASSEPQSIPYFPRTNDLEGCHKAEDTTVQPAVRAHLK